MHRNERKGNNYDVIVVGCGLAGITAALNLQKAGLTVCIIEKLDRCGGLCGTTEIDGLEFVIGCNDFGTGIKRIFKRLGVVIDFHNPETWLCYKGTVYKYPPNPGTLIKNCVKNWLVSFQLIKFFAKVFIPKLRKAEEDYLESLANNTVNDTMLNNLIKILIYMYGVKSSEFRVDTFRDEVKFRYGHDKLLAPRGGPQEFANRLIEKFLIDGEIHKSLEVVDIKRDNGWKIVSTNRGNYRAKQVISTIEKKEEAVIKEGLPLSAFLLGLDSSFLYPENIHTIVHWPPDPSGWFDMLDRGEKPQEFGFHIFKSDLRERNNIYTANVFFYLPRNMNSPSEDEIADVKQYIFENLEIMLPGIKKSVRYSKFISPHLFSKLYGLSSKPTPYVTPAKVAKRGNYDPESDIYYAGASYYPPGDHAGSAVLSGMIASNYVISRMQKK